MGGGRWVLVFCHGECYKQTATEHEMFVHNVFAICDGDDMIKKSLSFHFIFLISSKRLKDCCQRHPLKFLYHGMVHYIPMVY